MGRGVLRMRCVTRTRSDGEVQVRVAVPQGWNGGGVSKQQEATCVECGGKQQIPDRPNVDYRRANWNWIPCPSCAAGRPAPPVPVDEPLCAVCGRETDAAWESPEGAPVGAVARHCKRPGHKKYGCHAFVPLESETPVAPTVLWGDSEGGRQVIRRARPNEDPRWPNHCVHGLGHTGNHTCDLC